VLHIYPFKTKRSVTIALMVDLVCIGITMGLSLMPFVAPSNHYLVLTYTAIMTAVQVLCVTHQFRGHEGLDTPSTSSDVPRSLFLLVGFIIGAATMGEATAYSGLWWVCTATYILAFTVSAPVTASHMVEPFYPAIPWHVKGFWSLHEDFHLLLLLADTASLVLAWQVNKSFQER
jgi:hypothetical protein